MRLLTDQHVLKFYDHFNQERKQIWQQWDVQKQNKIFPKMKFTLIEISVDVMDCRGLTRRLYGLVINYLAKAEA